MYGKESSDPYLMKSRTEKSQRAFELKDINLLKKVHKKGAIRKQIHGTQKATKAEYLGEFVYGAIDGTITTFAVVAGATGAALSPAVVIILGVASLLADGFSMACGSFMSERTHRDYIRQERKREAWEIKTMPEGEKEEIREIFKKKGFKGKDLDKAVKIITSNQKVWIDTMMADELGLMESAKSPLGTAFSTMTGFILIGAIPLLAYVLAYFVPFFETRTFQTAIIMTLIALVIIGGIKSYITKINLWKSSLTTVLIGGSAAIIAYYIGFFLRWLVE